ncbi:MAG: hypothetical protein EB127_21060, partial [Alphaproteobacteria bacterium]|nr:hypothetical protein [Alphaproteobacteria bacterium]
KRIKKIENAISITGLNIKKKSPKIDANYLKSANLKMKNRNYIKQGGPLYEDPEIDAIVEEYSSKEEGVRTLIRTAEAIITRLNMLRIADEETMKIYKFYIKVDFPLQLNEAIIKTLLTEMESKEPEPWRSMYT